MDSDVQSSRDARPIPVTVGIVADDRSRADVLQPVIQEQGWTAVTVDPQTPLGSPDAEISLLVFSLAHISPGALEMIASVGIKSRASVLVVSDDRNPQVIADALRSGADDYLVSPFAPAELIARMRSLVTRIWPSTDRRTGNGIKFDVEQRTIETGPYAVEFTPLEWDVLSILLEQDATPISAEAIVDGLYRREVQASTIPTIISRIRRKLAARSFQAISVATVQHRGYVAEFRRASDKCTVTTDAGRAGHTPSVRPGAPPPRGSDTQRLKSVH